MEKSNEIGSLATALALAQSEFSAAIKDQVNPHFKSGFASLTSIWDMVRVPLSKNKLSVVQCAEGADVGVSVTTTLLHASGQFISSTLTIPTPKKDAQGYGAAISYGRRYALASMLGVSQVEEDDANSISTQQPQAPKTSNRITIVSQLVKLAGWSNDEVKAFVSDKYKKTKVDELSDIEFQGLTETIKASIKE